MEHKISIGKFPPGKRDYLSEIPFSPENVQWNEPKSRVPFTFQPEFPEFFGKWKTSPILSIIIKLDRSAVLEIQKDIELNSQPCDTKFLT